MAGQAAGGNKRVRIVWRRARPYLIPLILCALLGAWAVSEVLARAGEPALPLDDSFIHLQYARRFAQGDGFSYSAGAGYSSGATSWLWALVMEPFFWLGLDGLQLVWVGWLLGALLHAAVVVEVARLAGRLGGSTAAAGAGAMALVFGAFVWFAYSGMETVALVWVLLRGVRVAAARLEDDPAKRPSRVQLLALGLLAPLVRPEGALISLIAAIAGLWMCRRARAGIGRWLTDGVLPLVGPFIIPACHYAFTGSASSATAIVKWAALDPYLDRDAFIGLSLQNVRLLITDLLNGGGWTRLFVPEHFAWALAFGCAVVLLKGAERRRRWTALLLLLGVAATAGPCSYSTLLWNRVRYIWPFAGFWLVAVAVGLTAIGEGLAKIRPLMRIVAPVLLGGAVAALASKLSWTVYDLAQSARAISLQQVALGKWAREAIEDDALIGVNDTGAIAYFSGKRTFDVVGLTTRDEARYWAEGAGSRFEHYERMPRAQLPSHFIVYPGWMAMSAVLGEELHSATVTDQSILGGATMVAYRARYQLLGTGSAPFAATSAGPLLDVLDVADLQSEQAHRYERLDALGRYNRSRVGSSHDGRALADGGRLRRRQDRFVVGPLGASLMVMRVTAAVALSVRVGEGAPLRAEVAAAGEPWDEQMVALPALDEATSITVSAPDGSLFDAYHYFWLQRR